MIYSWTETNWVEILKPLFLRIVYAVYKPNLKGPKRLWRGAEWSFATSRSVFSWGAKVSWRGAKVSFLKKGVEVVGAEVVGAEVVGAEVVGAEVVGAEVVGAEVSIPFHLSL